LAFNSAIYSRIALVFALNRILSLANQNENEIILTSRISGFPALANQIAEKYRAKRDILQGNFAISAQIPHFPDKNG